MLHLPSAPPTSPTTLHCLCPAAGAASATESRSSARRIRCAAQLLSRFETGREGEGTRREAIFSYF